MGDRGDDYVTVPVKVMVVTRDAAQFARGAVIAWVPRSTIHGADDRRIAGARRGEEMKVRIFRWKATETLLLHPSIWQGSLFG